MFLRIAKGAKDGALAFRGQRRAAFPSIAIRRGITTLAALALTGAASLTFAAASDDASSQSKPKFDWETARVEFGAEAIAIKKPTFEISVPDAAISPASLADPELIYAILRPTFRALEGISVNTVEVSDGTVNVRQGTTRVHQLTALNAKFQISSAAGLTTGTGTVSLRGETLTFETAFARPDAETPDGAIPLRLKVSGAGLKASFEGTAQHSDGAKLDGAVDVTVSDLRKLAKWSGFTVSDGDGLNTFRTIGKMVWTAGLFAMSEGKYSLDGNEASGVLSLNLRKARASVEGTLALARLDLTNYFVESEADSSEPSTVLGTLVPAIGAETVLDAPILRDFDADVRVSVSEIKSGSFQTGAGAMTLSLRSGNLMADIAELQVFGGAVVGQLEFNVSKPDLHISARGLLDNIKAGEAMRWVTNVQAIRGRARMTTNVEAQGRTLSALMRSLKGEARLTMLKGGAFQVDVDGLMKQAREEPLIGWDVAKNRETVFGSLEARLLLENARISTRGLRADRDDDTRIIAYGTINLAEQNVSVRMSIVDKPDDVNGTVAVVKNGPTLTLQGPWDEPSISVEKQAENALPKVIKVGEATGAAATIE